MAGPLVSNPNRLLLLLFALLAGALLTNRQTVTQEKAPPSGVMWVIPRFDGFNNQRITLYHAAYCARARNWTLVVPHMYQAKTYDTRNVTEPAPFGTFFHVPTLSRLVKVAEPSQAASMCTTVALRAENDDLCRYPRLMRYYQGAGFADLRYRCVSGMTRKIGRNPLPEDVQCFAIDMGSLEAICPLKGDAGAFGPYSNYEATGQGFSVTVPTFREVYSHFKPSRLVLQVKSTLTAELRKALGGANAKYIALHLRRGDYREKCAKLSSLCDRVGAAAFVQSKEDIVGRIRTLDGWSGLPIFIATNDEPGVRSMNLTDAIGARLVFAGDLDLGPIDWKEHGPDVFSYAVQLVAAEADFFIGNRISSFSSEITNMRRLEHPERTSLFW
eukprot:CAMPEP_0198310806 /NCGR_PEP_ID=MMETSP1450-20131203/2734_1 /TAXON_ID=753684 ORGANISM="Madagascaria erythrocladiodes, Strain CCMP3234" /NCGR_SAMPLE_ID=MMETSP1450 /ASSEMBLY_ACC=CAM_ASM_001115 /LENGTH=385 /DNA_ID=CAMNT_0044013653 /DNA_START=180 /DNA_END=1337 /DNA_ORIENTATION=-